MQSFSFYTIIYDLCRTSNGFLISGSQDTTAKFWSLENIAVDQYENAKPLSLSSSFTLKTHDKEVNSIAVSTNDKQFATGSADKTAKVISKEFICPIEYLSFASRFGIFEIKNCSLFYQAIDEESGVFNIHLQIRFVFKKQLISVFIRTNFLFFIFQELATGSADGLIKIWSTKEYNCLQVG